ncbi:hypothetical protein GCM10018955_54620 [Planomonospora venezuelensis]
MKTGGTERVPAGGGGEPPVRKITTPASTLPAIVSADIAVTGFPGAGEEPGGGACGGAWRTAGSGARNGTGGTGRYGGSCPAAGGGGYGGAWRGTGPGAGGGAGREPGGGDQGRPGGGNAVPEPRPGRGWFNAGPPFPLRTSSTRTASNRDFMRLARRSAATAVSVPSRADGRRT